MNTMRYAALRARECVETALCTANLATPRAGVSTVVAHDSPVEAILRVAAEQGVDMIVTGSHGHRSIRHFLLGSVAERVVRRSRIPVTTVPASAQDAIQTILCPVNFTPVAKEAAETASTLAKQLGSALILLHLVEPQVFSDLQTEFERISEFLGDKLVNSWPTKVLVQRGDPAERILDYSLAHSIDLLVIGAQHRRFADVSVIGSTSERITRFAKCPVLMVTRDVPNREVIENELVGVTSS